MLFSSHFHFYMHILSTLHLLAISTVVPNIWIIFFSVFIFPLLMIFLLLFINFFISLFLLFQIILCFLVLCWAFRLFTWLMFVSSSLNLFMTFNSFRIFLHSFTFSLIWFSSLICLCFSLFIYWWWWLVVELVTFTQLSRQVTSMLSKLLWYTNSQRDK